MITETVYLGRDNTIDLELQADGRTINLTSVTKMELVDPLNGTAISSETSPAAFSWSGVLGILVLSLGEESLPVGSQVYSLVVYDGTNPDGIVWDEIKLNVKQV